jgi:tetratricopeptide (TPR) repeat protein
LILEKLSEPAALATLAQLAEGNPALAKTSEAERLLLYCETGGKPLLLRWTAGQVGRGSCLTSRDAVVYLRSCPEGNDPLEFIFGDLVGDFSDDETRVLCALTFFTLPARVEHIAELAGSQEADADRALRRLINRSVVVPSEELKTFTLVPLVAEFLAKRKPEAVAQTGDRLETRAYKLVVENGHPQHEQIPVLEAAWPTVAAALPRFIVGPNERLQIVCRALRPFLEFTGCWDEALALARDAESCAAAAADFLSAGWRAYDAGWIHYLREQSAEVIACADRADAHWIQADTSARNRAVVIQLRGIGYHLAKDYRSAIEAFSKLVEIHRTLGCRMEDVAVGLNGLANADAYSGPS